MHQNQDKFRIILNKKNHNRHLQCITQIFKLITFLLISLCSKIFMFKRSYSLINYMKKPTIIFKWSLLSVVFIASWRLFSHLFLLLLLNLKNIGSKSGWFYSYLCLYCNCSIIGGFGNLQKVSKYFWELQEK